MVSMGIGVMPSLILLCWPSSLLIRTIRTVLHLWAWRARVRSVLQYFKTSLLSLWILSHTSQVLLTQPFHLHQHAHVSWKHPSYNERNKANPKEKTKPSNVLWLHIIHQVTDIYFSPLLLKKKKFLKLWSLFMASNSSLSFPLQPITILLYRNSSTLEKVITFLHVA